MRACTASLSGAAPSRLSGTMLLLWERTTSDSDSELVLLVKTLFGYYGLRQRRTGPALWRFQEGRRSPKSGGLVNLV